MKITQGTASAFSDTDTDVWYWDLLKVPLLFSIEDEIAQVYFMLWMIIS